MAGGFGLPAGGFGFPGFLAGGFFPGGFFPGGFFPGGFFPGGFGFFPFEGFGFRRHSEIRSRARRRRSRKVSRMVSWVRATELLLEWWLGRGSSNLIDNFPGVWTCASDMIHLFFPKSHPPVDHNLSATYTVHTTQSMNAMLT